MKLPLSICIIARDAEKTIHRCLQSVTGIAGEIIFIDTGSEDNTAFIARKYGAKVYSFIWKDDFSEARNEAFKYVSYPWNLFIDADEELILKEPEKFSALLADPVTDSYYLTREEILSEQEVSETIRCRLLKTEKRYRYNGRIHETPDINADSSAVISKNIVFLKHYGYNLQFSATDAKKQRNLTILRDIIKTNKDINYLVYLLKELGQTDSREKVNIISKIAGTLETLSTDEIKSNLVLVSFYQEAVLTYSYLDNAAQVEKLCLAGLAYFPAELTLLSMAGEFYFRNKDYDKSLFYYLKIPGLVKEELYLKGPTVHQGVKTYGTYYNIALCYKMKAEIKPAMEYAEKALKSNPGFSQAAELLEKLKPFDN